MNKLWQYYYANIRHPPYQITERPFRAALAQQPGVLARQYEPHT